MTLVKGTAAVNVETCEVLGFWGEKSEKILTSKDFSVLITDAVLVMPDFWSEEYWVFTGKNSESYAQCFVNLLEEQDLFDIFADAKRVIEKMSDICGPYIMHSVSGSKIF